VFVLYIVVSVLCKMAPTIWCSHINNKRFTNNIIVLVVKFSCYRLEKIFKGFSRVNGSILDIASPISLY
jgi:hypothetical protein